MTDDRPTTDLPDPLDAAGGFNEVQRIIQSRKTSKVLLPVELRLEQRALWMPEHSDTLKSMLMTAAWAPFHKRAHEQYTQAELDAPMPWRFHVVDPDACTRLLAFLEKQASESADSKWTRAWQSKIKEMLCACGVLIQATWLPDPVSESGIPDDARGAGTADTSSSGDGFGPGTGGVIAEIEFNQKNIEHVAAAASAVQSLLVAAQSNQWLSYWSSGGILRDPEIFDYMGIDRREQLLGSLFLSPQAHPAARIIDGGLRDQRGAMSGWVHWV